MPGGRPAHTWENVESFIKSRITIDPTTNCWLWQGEIGPSGYGRIRMGYVKESVNRIMAILHLKLDKYDRDLFVLHKPICPNKHCCNPEHLYIGTGKDNWADFKKTKQWKVKHLGSRWKKGFGEE